VHGLIIQAGRAGRKTQEKEEGRTMSIQHEIQAIQSMPDGLLASNPYAGFRADGQDPRDELLAPLSDRDQDALAFLGISIRPGQDPLAI
jgi:hypothetical protein